MNISLTKRTGKNINKFRDECRKWVNESALPPAQKLVLSTLANYVNSESLIAWPSFDRLAEDTGVSRRTVINAINSARKLGVIKRLYKGGKLNGRGKSNGYLFPLYDRHSANFAPCQPVPGHDTVQITTRHSANNDATQCKPCTLSPNDLLKDNLIGASAVALESVVGAETTKAPEDSERGSGEETEITPTNSENPTTERAGKPKQTDAELCIEMAARGMDMSRSKLRGHQPPPAEIYSAPPGPNERTITISQALIDQIKKKGAAA